MPGSFHQGTKPVYGDYTYTITPRYFDDKESLLPLDSARCVVVTVYVGPFEKGDLKLGFARGYTQSQAFSNNFGAAAKIRPEGKELLYDTSKIAGKNPKDDSFTYARSRVQRARQSACRSPARGPEPVVYCGSSNLSMGGEQKNGDNLLCIRDAPGTASWPCACRTAAAWRCPACAARRARLRACTQALTRRAGNRSRAATYLS